MVEHNILTERGLARKNAENLTSKKVNVRFLYRAGDYRDHAKHLIVCEHCPGFSLILNAYRKYAECVEIYNFSGSSPGS